MARKYTRKAIYNLDELDKEQARIRSMYRKMEHHWIDTVFEPEKMLFSVASALLSGRGNRKANRTDPGSRADRAQLSGLSAFTSLWNKPAVQQAVKRIGGSWLRWQAFNLAFLLGKKTMSFFQKRREQRRQARMRQRRPGRTTRSTDSK